MTSAGAATYRYRGDSLRLAKTVSGVTTAFAWDESGSLPELLSETKADATTRYVYGPGGLPLEQVDASGTVTYLHPDQLGSIRVLTQGVNVVGTRTYDPYGRPAGSTGTVTSPFGFAGEYTDAETGFQYLRSRYYDPATGQFATVDPAYETTKSRYGYADGNPLNLVDPSGLSTVGLCFSGGGVLASLLGTTAPLGGSGQLCLATDGSQIGITASINGPAGVTRGDRSWGASIGVQITSARDLRALEGPFAYADVGYTTGLDGIQIGGFYGGSACAGDAPVAGGTVGWLFGRLGPSATAGVSKTKVIILHDG